MKLDKDITVNSATLQTAIKYITYRCHGRCCFDDNLIKCKAIEHYRREDASQVEALDFARGIKEMIEGVTK